MATKERVILHADMNNFYASVECMLNPKLRGHPVAVGGDVAARNHSCQKLRSQGIRNPDWRSTLAGQAEV